jgi:hypothetical protein
MLSDDRNSKRSELIKDIHLLVLNAKSIASEAVKNLQKNYTRNECSHYSSLITDQLTRLSKIMTDFEAKNLEYYSHSTPDKTTLETSEDGVGKTTLETSENDITDALVRKFAQDELSERIAMERAQDIRSINQDVNAIKGLFQEVKFHSFRV